MGPGSLRPHRPLQGGRGSHIIRVKVGGKPSSQ